MLVESGFIHCTIRQVLSHFIMTGMCRLSTGDAHQSGLRHERGRRLWFDVSEVPAGERIVSAELRLFRSEGSAPQRATVSVYQIVADERGWVVQPFFILKMLCLQEAGLVLRRDRMREVCCDRTRAECCRVWLDCANCVPSFTARRAWCWLTVFLWALQGAGSCWMWQTHLAPG